MTKTIAIKGKRVKCELLTVGTPFKVGDFHKSDINAETSWSSNDFKDGAKWHVQTSGAWFRPIKPKPTKAKSGKKLWNGYAYIPSSGLMAVRLRKNVLTEMYKCPSSKVFPVKITIRKTKEKP